MRLGVKNGELVLVKESDTNCKLIFDSLKPSYPLDELKVMSLTPSSHPGKGVVL